MKRIAAAVAAVMIPATAQAWELAPSQFAPSLGQTLASPAQRPAACPIRSWCGCWLASALGIDDRSLWRARAWLHYGRPAAEGCTGCIAVLSRGRHGGHVGIVQGYDARGNPIILSGNHNNRVAVATYDRRRVLGYRWGS